MPRCRSRWRWLLALGAFWLSALPGGAYAADYDEPPPGPVRAIKIGDTTLVVDEMGNAIMYEDTGGEEPDCVGPGPCWGFEAADSAGIVISPGGKTVQGVDTATGRVFEETTAPP